MEMRKKTLVLLCFIAVGLGASIDKEQQTVGKNDEVQKNARQQQPSILQMKPSKAIQRLRSKGRPKDVSAMMVCVVVCNWWDCTIYHCPGGICCTPGSPNSVCCPLTHPECLHGNTLCCPAGMTQICGIYCCYPGSTCCRGRYCCRGDQQCCGNDSCCAR